MERSVLPQGPALAVLSLVHECLLPSEEGLLMELCRRQAGCQPNCVANAGRL